MKHLAANIKTLRLINNLSQEKLAKKLDIRPHTIIAWEQGVALPSLPNLIAFRKLFNISLEHLVFHKFTRPKDSAIKLGRTRKEKTQINMKKTKIAQDIEGLPPINEDQVKLAYKFTEIISEHTKALITPKGSIVMGGGMAAYHCAKLVFETTAKELVEAKEQNKMLAEALKSQKELTHNISSARKQLIVEISDVRKERDNLIEAIELTLTGKAVYKIIDDKFKSGVPTKVQINVTLREALTQYRSGGKYNG